MIHMKTHILLSHRIIGILSAIVLLFVVDVAEAQSAEAVAHSHRATRRRTAVVVSSATQAKDEQAAAAQQSETATTSAEAVPAGEAAPAAEAAPAPTGQTDPTTAPATAPATQAAPAPQATSSGGPLPMGTVVTSLPGGCEATPVDNVQYYHCGADYYRVAYQGSNLVYVTTDLPK